jgi:hypothetical protein
MWYYTGRVADVDLDKFSLAGACCVDGGVDGVGTEEGCG